MSTTDRIQLWFHNKDAAMLALAPVVSKREDIMIVLADMRDPVASPLVKAVAQATKQDTENHIRKVEGKGEIPTAILILPAEIVRMVVADSNPMCAEALQSQPPEGMVWICVIAYSGTMVFQAPIELVKHAGSG